MDLGFSPQAIENRRVYVEFGQNAFAVSKTAEHIFVVLSSQLIEKLNFVELRSVFAHELSHIKNQHVIERHIESILSSLAVEIYSNGVPDQIDNDLLGRLLKYMRLINRGPETKITAHSVGEDGTQPSSRSNLRNIIEDAFESLLTLERTEFEALMRDFLEIQLKRLKEMKAQEEDISFHKSLFALDPFDKSHKDRLPLDALLQKMNRAFNALSQAQEESADRFGTSVTSSDQTAAATLFATLDVRLQREDRISMLDQVQQQWQRFQTKFSQDERAAHSFGSTHPGNIPRISKIMQTPAYPAILFANPFLRLLLLEDELNLKLGYLSTTQSGNHPENVKVDSLILVLQKRLFNLITQSGIERGSAWAAPANPHFDNYVQFITSQIELRRQIQRAKGTDEATIKQSETKSLSKNRLFIALAGQADYILKSTPIWQYKRRRRIQIRLDILTQIARGETDEGLRLIRRRTSPVAIDSVDGIRASRIPVNLLTSCRSLLTSKR
ncbi:MAG: M48 family metalloprotease [Bdellovibrionales bacterium]|nr:M48 family metalloprotease [Bdellovibrionales bacterium]